MEGWSVVVSLAVSASTSLRLGGVQLNPRHMVHSKMQSTELPLPTDERQFHDSDLCTGMWSSLHDL